MKQIKNLDELKLLATDPNGEKDHDFFILLGGLCRSSKVIWYDPDTKLWSITNEIDDTNQDDLTDDMLEADTNIVEALNKGALFIY